MCCVGYDVVVVVSVMGDIIDELFDFVNEVVLILVLCEFDMFFFSGECILMVLLVMVIYFMGFEVCLFMGSQVGMIIDLQYGVVCIVDVIFVCFCEVFDEGVIVIVVGFQGFNCDICDIIMFGWGGLDIMVVVLVVVFGVDVCEIYSDVDGIFIVDLCVILKVQKFDYVFSEEMFEFVVNGVKVLYICVVEYVCCYGVFIYVWLMFLLVEGIYVLGEGMKNFCEVEGVVMEELIVVGVVIDFSQVKIMVVGVFDVLGKVVEIFKIVVKFGVNVDMIVQNVLVIGCIDIFFIVFKVDVVVVFKVFVGEQIEVGFQNLIYDDQIGKLFVVGVGMCMYFGVLVMLFEVLFVGGINIEMIFILEICILVVLCDIDLIEVVCMVYIVYGFDGDVEVMVYVGIGC